MEVAVAIDLRKLVKAGALLPGGCHVQAHSGFRTIADLREGKPPRLTVEYPTGNIELALMTAGRFKGKRFFLVDERGKPRDVLYLCDGKFVSRETARLRYASQYRKEMRKRSSGAPDPQEPIAAENTPAPRWQRVQRVAMRTSPGIGPAEISNAASRQRRSRERLRDVMRSLRAIPVVSSKEVLQAFERTAQLAIRGKRRPMPVLRAHGRKDAQVEDGLEAELDVVSLTRLELIRKGERTAFQLGWPEAWTGVPGRHLFVISDWRDPVQPHVVIIYLDGSKRPRWQWFWIAEIDAGSFGRPELRFMDDRGRLARKVLYRKGKFALRRGPSVRQAQLQSLEPNSDQKSRVEAVSPQSAPPAERAQLKKTDQTRTSNFSDRQRNAARKPDETANSAATQTNSVPSQKQLSMGVAGWSGSAEQTQIIDRYLPLAEAAKARSPRATDAARSNRPSPADGTPALVRVDDLPLFLIQHEVRAVEINCPPEWRGQPDLRIYVLVDTRATEYAAFILQDGLAEPIVQIFWIRRLGLGMFHYFEDPITGEQADVLYLRAGRFGFENLPMASPELTKSAGDETSPRTSEPSAPNSGLSRLARLRAAARARTPSNVVKEGEGFQRVFPTRIPKFLGSSSLLNNEEASPRSSVRRIPKRSPRKESAEPTIANPINVKIPTRRPPAD